MERYITDERTGLNYELVGSHYLIAGEDTPEHAPIGVWGQRHLRYLKARRRVLYVNLLTSGALNRYLVDLDRQAEELFLRLVNQMAAAGGHHRSTKSRRPNGMGQADEQRRKSGSGNCKRGIDQFIRDHREHGGAYALPCSCRILRGCIKCR